MWHFVAGWRLVPFRSLADDDCFYHQLIKRVKLSLGWITSSSFCCVASFFISSFLSLLHLASSISWNLTNPQSLSHVLPRQWQGRETGGEMVSSEYHRDTEWKSETQLTSSALLEAKSASSTTCSFTDRIRTKLGWDKSPTSHCQDYLQTRCSKQSMFWNLFNKI